MHSLNLFSRRNFVKKLYLGAAVPMLSPLLALAKDDRIAPLAKEGAEQLIPDLERVKQLFKQKNPLTWLFTGASIVQGAVHLHGHRSYPEIFAERVRYEMSRYRDIIINSGVSGATVAHILDDFDWRVGRFKADVVFVGDLGANDCREKNNIPMGDFERMVNALISKIRETDAIPVLQTPNVFFNLEKSMPDMVRYVDYADIVRKLAENKQIILVDHWAYWNRTIQSRSETEVCKNWSNDGIHPNGTGHSEMARLIFRELSIYDPKLPTCGGEGYWPGSC